MKKLMVLLGVALVLIAAVVGWLMLGENRNNPEALRERVNEYWQAVKINDQHTRYRMMTAYAEGKLQPDELRPQMSPQMSVLAYQVGDIRIEQDGTADVTVDVTLTLPNFGGKGFHRQSREIWTYFGDNWYRGLRSEDRKQLRDYSDKPDSNTDEEIKE
ncbi:MAG: hypothetical protein RLZZ09_2252 [Pseudomonadota bacterium]|jgi:hypothetical protein